MREPHMKTCKECGVAYKPRKHIKMLLCYLCYCKYINASMRRRVQKTRDKFNTWKAKKGCSRCTENDPDCLEMHHLNPAEKESAVSLMVCMAVSWDKIMKESAKCIVVCANCHRKLHDVIETPDPLETRQRRHQRKKRDWFRAWKRGNGCTRCEETDPVCLDMHHLDPTKKESKISNIVTKGGAWDRIMKEAAKCIIVCANCHRKLHAEQRE